MGFAHRGLHGPGIPENSMAAFRAAVAAGAGIECDVRLSGDGQPVVFHDHDLRRLCASALTVEAASAAALTGQKLYETQEQIPLLAELLDMVAGRVPMLVEVKCRGGNAGRITQAIAAQLEEYGGPIGIMSFEPSVGRWLKRHAPHLRRGLVISERASLLDRWRSIRAARPQFLAIDYGAIGRTWVARQRKLRWVYSWTIRSADQRQTGAVHADALIWEGDGRPRS
jgi:glycerophosphoryl diester phosphodiesterase